MHRTNSRNVALQIVSADSSYQAGYEYNFSYTGPSDLNRVRWKLKPLENRKGKHKNMAEPEEWEVLHPTYPSCTPALTCCNLPDRPKTVKY